MRHLTGAAIVANIPFMFKLTLIALLFSTACFAGDNDPGAEVTACRAAANDRCETIGYGGNETCYLAFAQHCSADDAQDAHDLCMSAPGATEPCVLTWR